MRFQSPKRESVSCAAFRQPAFHAFAHRAELFDRAWPDVETLNALLGARRHEVSGVGLRFQSQTPALLADGLHYETRIFETGAIATRPENWHDLFNALMWLDRFPLKCAVNATYVNERDPTGLAPRTRPQYALTHFDEAGAIVVLREPDLLALWDGHDWEGLFWRSRDAWVNAARPLLFGHALLEHLLVPGVMPVAKCLVICAGTELADEEILALVAAGIVGGKLLRDPAELRPLPLAGLPGWHPDSARPAFYTEAACFRPVRADRRYPAALTLPQVARA